MQSILFFFFSLLYTLSCPFDILLRMRNSFEGGVNHDFALLFPESSLLPPIAMATKADRSTSRLKVGALFSRNFLSTPHSCNIFEKKEEEERNHVNESENKFKHMEKQK
jgi:hypothetical protein